MLHKASTPYMENPTKSLSTASHQEIRCAPLTYANECKCDQSHFSQTKILPTDCIWLDFQGHKLIWYGVTILDSWGNTHNDAFPTLEVIGQPDSSQTLVLEAVKMHNLGPFGPKKKTLPQSKTCFIRYTYVHAECITAFRQNGTVTLGMTSQCYPCIWNATYSTASKPIKPPRRLYNLIDKNL